MFLSFLFYVLFYLHLSNGSDKNYSHFNMTIEELITTSARGLAGRLICSNARTINFGYVTFSIIVSSTPSAVNCGPSIVLMGYWAFE